MNQAAAHYIIGLFVFCEGIEPETNPSAAEAAPPFNKGGKI